MKNTLKWLRIAGIAEGISFILLLGIAMPLKYLYDQPMAVKATGWLHGMLFISFVAFAWLYKTQTRKQFSWFLIAFIAAWLPLGTFYFHKKILARETGV